MSFPSALRKHHTCSLLIASIEKKKASERGWGRVRACEREGGKGGERQCVEQIARLFLFLSPHAHSLRRSCDLVAPSVGPPLQRVSTEHAQSAFTVTPLHFSQLENWRNPTRRDTPYVYYPNNINYTGDMLKYNASVFIWWIILPFALLLCEQWTYILVNEFLRGKGLLRVCVCMHRLLRSSNRRRRGEMEEVIRVKAREANRMSVRNLMKPNILNRGHQATYEALNRRVFCFLWDSGQWSSKTPCRHAMKKIFTEMK